MVTLLAKARAVVHLPPKIFSILPFFSMAYSLVALPGSLAEWTDSGVRICYVIDDFLLFEVVVPGVGQVYDFFFCWLYGFVYGLTYFCCADQGFSFVGECEYDSVFVWDFQDVSTFQRFVKIDVGAADQVQGVVGF